MKLLVFICALTAVQADKLEGHSSRNHNDGSTGTSLPIVNDRDLSISPSQHYATPANQRFSGGSNSIIQSPNTFSGQSFSAPNGLSGPSAQAFREAPSQSYSQPSNQLGSGSSGSGTQIVAAAPSRSFSIPSTHSSVGSSSQSSSGFSGSSGLPGPVSNSFSQSQAVHSGQAFGEPTAHSHSASGSTGQSFTGFSGSSFQAQPARASHSGSSAFQGQHIESVQPSQTYSAPHTIGGSTGHSFGGQEISHSFSGTTTGQSFGGSPISQSNSGSRGNSFSSQSFQPTQPTQTYSRPSVHSNSGSAIQSFSQSSGSSLHAHSAQPAQTFSEPSIHSTSGSAIQSFSQSSGSSLHAHSAQSLQPAQTFSGPSAQSFSSSTGASFSAQPVQSVQPAYSGPSNQVSSGFSGQSSSQVINPEFVRAGHSSSGFSGNAHHGASHQTGFGVNEGSFSGASSHRAQGSSGYEAPNVNNCREGEILHLDGSCVIPEVSRHVFVYAAPQKEGRSYGPPPEIPLPKEEHNIVFIRTPEGGAAQDPIVIPPPQKKHIIYVLNKDSGNQQQKVIEITTPKPKSPEVYFVNYAEGENPSLPGGIDFETALNSAVHADGQVIGTEGPSGPSGSFTSSLQGSHESGSHQGTNFGRGDFVSSNAATGSFGQSTGGDFAANINNFVDKSGGSGSAFSSISGGSSSFGGLELRVDDSHESFGDNTFTLGNSGNNRGNLQISPATGVPLPSSQYASP